MKSNVKNILHDIDIENEKKEVDKNKNISESDRRRAIDYMDKMEDEKNKTENQKQHERYVRYIRKMARETDLNIQKARHIETKPGLQFEGSLKMLAEKYETIDEITKHFTFGQLAKYYEEDGKLYRHKDGKLAYDEEKRECYE